MSEGQKNAIYNHPYPRVNEIVFVRERERQNLNPHGQIINVSRADDEVMVLFFGDGHQVCGAVNASHCVFCKHTHPNWFNGGGDCDTFSLEIFDGCWSSHDGGSGEWLLMD